MKGEPSLSLPNHLLEFWVDALTHPTDRRIDASDGDGEIRNGPLNGAQVECGGVSCSPTFFPSFHLLLSPSAGVFVFVSAMAGLVLL